MLETHQLQHSLRQAVTSGITPGIALGLRSPAGVQRFFEGQHAPLPGERAIDAQSLFDLASLTKPLTTLRWAHDLLRSQRLTLDTPVGDVLPHAQAALAHTPLWRLLNHTSGLPAHHAYFQGLGALARDRQAHDAVKRTVRAMLLRTPLVAPPGQTQIYSDLGYLLLEWIFEQLDAPLAQRWPQLAGHSQTSLHFRPLPLRSEEAPAALYVPTEACPWRHRRLRGEVHDDNAWAMGGVCGHAGLFGTLDAVLDQAWAWCRAGARGEEAPAHLSPALVAQLLSHRWRHPQGSHVLGWDTPSLAGSSAGRHFGPHSFGHLGFTGCSLWIDPDAQICMVLLTQRVYNGREDPRIRTLRPQVHDLAWAHLRAEGCFT